MLLLASVKRYGAGWSFEFWKIIQQQVEANGSRPGDAMAKFDQLLQLSQNHSFASSDLLPHQTTERDENERLLLHWAAKAGNARMVELLLSRHPEQLEAQDDMGYTPLVLAALCGHRTVVDLLVAAGANLNHCTKRGHSALQYCCSRGHLGIATYLLEAGAEVNIADRLRETPLHRAVVMGHTAIVQLLLDNGADINAINSTGNTPLHLACSEGQTGCALALLRRGARKDTGNSDGALPLQLAPREIQRALTEAMSRRNDG
ncbi:26S proteasome non-ATPase regulatory subunit 10 [Anopheles darlingi]|uniref:26S proteasome non-ATPase regulatory subunit 10 n=1 Tax=Anopheles darlingi TaxID=43151 RepID=W5JWD6_ANODA|nr:26S proteasome non-ATPase regulatory subunit 10-like [Anopheles darlingi]ETN67520.1 26S proteasome non-ATPase regulatory subunit 10 [Anopheles darlingi]